MEVSSSTRISRYAKAQYEVLKKLRIIYIVILAFAALFMWNGDGDGYYIGSSFSVILYVVAACMGIGLCIDVFKDLHSSQQADVELSLPLSAEERFFGKLLTILYIQILPTIISIFISTMSIINRSDMSGSDYQTLAIIILGYFSVVLFANGITVLCCCCCGTKGESSYVSFLSMGIISGLPALFYSFIRSCSTVTTSQDPKILSLWGIGSVFYSIFSGDYDDLGTIIVLLIINCLISIALIFACLFIYRKRDARHVGKPIVFRLFFEIFITLLMFTAFFMFSHSEMLIVGIIFTLLFYLVLRIILVRAKTNGKVVAGWLLHYASVLAVFVAIMAVCYFTYGFGYNPSIKLSEDSYSVNANIYYREDSLYNDYAVDELDTEYVEELMDTLDNYTRCENRTYSSFLEFLSGYDSTPEGSNYEVTVTIFTGPYFNTQTKKYYTIYPPVQKGKELDEYLSAQDYWDDEDDDDYYYYDDDYDYYVDYDI